MYIVIPFEVRFAAAIGLSVVLALIAVTRLVAATEGLADYQKEANWPKVRVNFALFIVMVFLTSVSIGFCHFVYAGRPQ